MTAGAAGQKAPGASRQTRTLLVVTGSLSAAFVPQGVGHLRMTHPGIRIRTLITRSALKFVTATAVAAATGGEVTMDAWEDDRPGTPAEALHVELAEWAERIVVYPASWHYVARLAQGLADVPSLLALHTSRAEVAVAPSVPPGSLDSKVFQRHLAELRDRGYRVAPVLLARSTGGTRPALVPPPMPDVMALFDQAPPAPSPPAPAGRQAAP
ncbi:hypothetical protein TU94_01370 [Streptomyces cyaneogriseus subsp. noncyanogenus]|uniref:Flavoprotein domain-containing protein n=1 Tax=Streptomyces cyaneogriseus subsp. noncyanogenus TaxID=477245 RepID=A0A0C5FVB4_9ACTN|nr:flavoprotein [Streptomyces cyaneogriseus]AJP00385.1 hypothetical protein TU94_01370 [Streptomyces cyaneogriseus subsp. noncyanogenus]